MGGATIEFPETSTLNRDTGAVTMARTHFSSRDRTTRKLRYAGTFFRYQFSSECMYCGQTIMARDPCHVTVYDPRLICRGCIALHKRELRNDRMRTHRAFARDTCGGSDGTRVCAACDRQFDARRSDSRYCSSACRQRAYRDRKRGTRDGSDDEPR